MLFTSAVSSQDECNYSFSPGQNAHYKSLIFHLRKVHLYGILGNVSPWDEQISPWDDVNTKRQINRHQDETRPGMSSLM